jgi:hypothetical protein
MFDKNLVHAIVGGKHPGCGWAEVRMNRMLTGGHGSLFLDAMILRPMFES